jgi:hypothetical protein
VVRVRGSFKRNRLCSFDDDVRLDLDVFDQRWLGGRCIKRHRGWRRVVCRVIRLSFAIAVPVCRFFDRIEGLRRMVIAVAIITFSVMRFGFAAIVIAIVIAMMIIIVIMLGVFLFLLAQQRLPISQRDLIIVRVDFGEGQEAMAIAAIFHEGRLERWLNARHLGQIDVAFQRTARGAFEIEFFDTVTAHHDNPGFLRVCGVDEHFAAHGEIPLREAGAELPPASGPVRREEVKLKAWGRERGLVHKSASCSRPRTSGVRWAMAALDRVGCKPMIILVFWQAPERFTQIACGYGPATQGWSSSEISSRTVYHLGAQGAPDQRTSRNSAALLVNTQESQPRARGKGRFYGSPATLAREEVRGH